MNYSKMDAVSRAKGLYPSNYRNIDISKNEIPKYQNIEVLKYQNIEISEYRNIVISKYRNIKISNYRKINIFQNILFIGLRLISFDAETT